MSENKFSVGDKVMRMKESFGGVILGKEYTVSEVRLGEIRVQDQNSFWYCADKFELVEENKMQKQFTKNDLKTGMRVIHRNGKVGVILNDIEVIYYPATESFNNILGFKEDLSAKIWQEVWDITHVYKGYSDGWVMNTKELGDLLWKREEKSPEQIEAEKITQEIESLKLRLEELSKKI